MLWAFRKVPFMVVQDMLPHCSMEESRTALSVVVSPRFTAVSPPVTMTR